MFGCSTSGLSEHLRNFFCIGHRLIEMTRAGPIWSFNERSSLGFQREVQRFSICVQKRGIKAGNRPLDTDVTARKASVRDIDAMAALSIRFTSGTIFRPKAVLRTLANGIWGAQVNATQMRSRHEDCNLVVLPRFHTNAQSYSMLSTLWAGATMVL